jgi:hypothetical protein
MRRRLSILFCLVLCVSCHSVLATPQMRNSLFFEGKEYPIDDDPMEGYFAKHADRRPKAKVRPSGLWRGYLTFFEFRGKDLFLRDLKLLVGTEEIGGRWKSVLKKSLGDGHGLKIDWFSGLIVSRYGENYYMDPYDFNEHRKHYSNYAIFEIDSGVLRKHRFFDNKGFLQFIKDQFDAFKKTPEYNEAVREKSKNGGNQKDAERWIEASVLDYSKKILVN